MLLDGKKLLITGVLTDDSIAFAVAKVAQEAGAEILLTNVGKGVRLTEKVARKLPTTPDVLQMDVNNPDDVAAKVRAAGGIADSQMVGDTEGAVKWMRAQPNHNGKVGLIGSCSGGRHAFLYACQRKDIDACVELWGGRVVMGKEELNAKTPVAPIDMTKDLSCPLLGIFGNDDRAPSPEQVDRHEAELRKHGKAYEFHRYDGAGHGIFYWHRPLYRPEQAMDGWGKVFAFFGKHLAKQED